MSKLRNTLVAGAFLALPLLSMSGASADSPTYNDNPDSSCGVYAKGDMNSENTTNSMFTVANGTASFTVVVTGPSTCTEDVSVASWQAPYGSTNFLPLNSQILLYSSSQKLGVGTHQLSIKLADCDYQVDILNNASPTANGTPTYVPTSRLFGWIQAGNKVCEQPTTPPVAPVVPTTPAAPAAPVVPAAPATPAPAAQPTTLVNTGPGNIVGMFAAVSVAGAVLHGFITRKFAK